MTNERAIELLNRISDSQFDGIHGDERREALDMAVRALSGDGDMISRWQALKEMWKALYEYEDKTEKQFQESKDLDVRDWIMNDRLWVQNGHNLCVNVLANLPSAQPTQTNADSTHENTLDCVSRQQAIEAFEPEHRTDWYTPRIIEVLEALPSAQVEITEDDVKEYCRKRCLIVLTSDFYNEMKRRWASAQPERKKGKWISEVKGKKAIIDENGNVTCSAHCSECGDWLTGSDEYACRGRFCPNCGARMDGEGE